MAQVLNFDQAIALLKAGGVGVIPTDTVYGLVARAADKKAVKRLYALKHREHKPGTVIAANVAQLVTLGVPEPYLKRVEQWWPNPLSVIVPAGEELGYLHQGLDSLGVRIPKDNQLNRLLEETGPLVTSSANQPGGSPATTLDEAVAYFGEDLDFYVEGGDLSARVPSTIVRMLANRIEVIRQGEVEIDDVGLKHIAPSVSECPFCRANGKLKGDVLFATEQAYLIHTDLSPGNYLIIPDTHVESLEELPDTWWAEVKGLLRQVPGLVGDHNLSVNIGKVAGQTVRHIHFWVIPRHAGEAASGKGFVKLIEEANQV